MFRELITDGLRRFSQLRPPSIPLVPSFVDIQHTKRQMEFIAGFFVSNIITTAMDWLMTRSASHLQERLASAEQRLVALNAQIDLYQISIKAMERTLRAEQAAINLIHQQVGQLAELSVLVDYYIAEMHMVRAKHDRLFSSLRTGNPDLTTIAEIFDTAAFGRIQVRDIERITVDNPVVNVLRIRIQGPIRAKDTTIYDVIAFPYYSNFSGKTGWKYEYNGSLRVMLNSTNGCVKGLGTSASKHYIQDSCSSAGSQDKSLKSWRKTFIPRIDLENFRPVANIIWPSMRIQCFGKNITITTPQNKTSTTTCPGFTTSLHLQNTFRTSDGIINHLGGGVKKLLYTPKINQDVLNFHFEDDEFRPVHKELEASIKQSDEAIEAQDRFRNSTVAFVVNNHSVTTSTLLYSVIILIMAINAYLGFRCYQIRNRDKTKIQLIRKESARRNRELQEAQLSQSMTLASINAWRGQTSRSADARSVSSERSSRRSRTPPSRPTRIRSTMPALQAPPLIHTIVPTTVQTIYDDQ